MGKHLQMVEATHNLPLPMCSLRLLNGPPTSPHRQPFPIPRNLHPSPIYKSQRTRFLHPNRDNRERKILQAISRHMRRQCLQRLERTRLHNLTNPPHQPSPHLTSLPNLRSIIVLFALARGTNLYNYRLTLNALMFIDTNDTSTIQAIDYPLVTQDMPDKLFPLPRLVLPTLQM